MAAQRALVTGGTGFVGAALARFLLDRGWDVGLLVRSTHAAWRLTGIERDVELHETVLTDAESVDRTMAAARPDAVFHLAVHGAYSSQVDAVRMIETNVLGTHHLLTACIANDVGTLVNTGSSSEYGLRSEPPRESDALHPNSHYAVTKAAATMLCQLAGARGELRAPTMRLYSVYGPWEEPTRLVPTLVARCLGGALPPFVDPAIARDFVHIDDVCDAYLRVCESSTLPPDAVYNVASGHQTRLDELVDVARRVFDVDQEPEWGSMPNRAWDTDCWVGDPGCLSAATDWRAHTTLERGLRSFGEWLRADAELLAEYRRRIDARLLPQ